MKIINASASGKVIIAGEHAVVYGGQALAAPLSRYVTFFCENYGPECHQTHFFIENKIDPQFEEILEQLWQKTLDLFGSDYIHISCKTSSSIPLGGGLGSSAALCVALIRLAEKILQKNLNSQEKINFANTLETFFHGSPSGLDVSTSVFESLIVFEKGQVATPVTLSKDANELFQFVLIDSGERSSTKDMIARGKNYFFGSAIRQDIIQNFNTETQKCLTALVEREPNLLAQSFKTLESYLNAAGVVTPKMRSIIDKCEDLGCLASKPTGAGGGGYILTFLGANTNKNKYLEIENRLRSTFSHGEMISFSL